MGTCEPTNPCLHRGVIDDDECEGKYKKLPGGDELNCRDDKDVHDCWQSKAHTNMSITKTVLLKNIAFATLFYLSISGINKKRESSQSQKKRTHAEHRH